MDNITIGTEKQYEYDTFVSLVIEVEVIMGYSVKENMISSSIAMPSIKLSYITIVQLGYPTEESLLANIRNLKHI